MNNSSVPIESNRFSKWQAHAHHKKVWVPPPTLPPPRSPAFIDTLSSCLRNGTQESYFSPFFFFFFFFKPNAVFFFFKFVGPRFYLFIFLVLLKVFFFRFCSRVIISWYIYRNYGVYRFAVEKPFRRIYHFRVRAKIEKLAKLEEKIPSVRSV